MKAKAKTKAKTKAKFKIGQNVKIKPSFMKFILSHEGQDGYFVRGCEQNKEQSEDHDSSTIAAMLHLMYPSITGVVIEQHYVGDKGLENYRVSILDAEFNIDPNDLIKARK